MAKAMLISIQDIQQPVAPNITWTIGIVILGSDVAGGFRRDETTFDTSIDVTPAQLKTAAGQAIRAKATSLGYTIPAGFVLLPSFVTD